MKGRVYIGTILLERNRWARGKQPTYRVSQWVPRFKKAGFDGMELWENHAALASPTELEALRQSDFPMAVFNSYATFDPGGSASRLEAARLATLLGARGVKFNLGNDAAQRDTYVQSALEWQKRLPAGTRMLCECHSGTIMEDPLVAKEVFASWGNEAFQAIVHPFTTDTAALQRWFDCLGARITHAHVQLRDESGTMQLLERQPKVVDERLRLMREAGFAGSFTLEFAEGTGSPNESMEALFDAALADLSYLRECLA